MTILIHAIGSEVIAYPATLDALRQEFPNCSFPIEPTAEDLAPFNRFFVTPIPAPSCDPRTERTKHDPTLTDDGWQQAWTIRPASDEEITAYDLAHQPEPAWMEFGIDLAMHSGIAALYAAISGPVANGLSIGLNEVGKGDPRLFSGLWQRVMASDTVPAGLLSDIAALAVQHHLPAPFIAGLAPAAPERERARDEEGLFIADDPATPDVDEAWLEVPAG
jgi:hypothetical protein